jgi:outer membrane immunogenic protein
LRNRDGVQATCRRHAGGVHVFRRASAGRPGLSKIASRLSGMLVLAASLLAASPSLATAAELASNYYTAARSVAFGWAGPYVATLGYEWGGVDNNPAEPKGVAGGLEAGFNWQNGSFVYGGEADFSFSAAEDTFASWQFSNPWFGTVRGRAGIAVDNVLLFGTVGLAYGELTGTAFGAGSESHSNVGWVAGLGAELSFAPHWSAKAEWLYLDFDDRHFAVTGANNGLAANLVRLGLNHRF